MSRKHIFIIFYWFLVTLSLPNIVLCFSEEMDIWARITNLLLPVGILGTIATLSPELGKTIWVFSPMAFICSFQLVLLGLYGSGIISVDMFLNLATTNTIEVMELLGNLLPAIISVVILYGIPLVTSVWFIHKRMTLPGRFLKMNRKVLVTMTLAGVLSLSAAYIYSPHYTIRENLYPINIVYNIYLATERTVRSTHQHETSSGYRFDSRPTHNPGEKEIYVVVIGETSRAANWQLFGYYRPTNPSLSQREDILSAPDTYSESNTTHKSVPMLMSNVSSGNFDSDIHKVKSLVTAFKEAGFHTAFISNQQPNHSYIDFFAFEADTTLFVRGNAIGKNIFNDNLLMKPFTDIISSDYLKQLIVLHTYGSHFNYLDRYRPEHATFKPDRFNIADKKYRKELINAYDNTIVMTDRFLDQLISLIEKEDRVSALIYTSDHGEDIYENGKSFLHASPNPSVMQLHVPFILWLSPSYIKEYPQTFMSLKSNLDKQISSSRSFSPTIISLSGIKTGKDIPQADLCSPQYSPTERVYLNDHNTPIPLSVILK